MLNLPDYAFLHGGGQGSWVWDETVAAMKSQADQATGKIVALDVPGCGAKRGRAAELLDNDAIARELIADLEREELHEVILVGHSQAGQVLPLMAALRPDLFRRLVYVTCSIPLPGQSVAQMMGSSPHGENNDEVGFPFDPKQEKFSERYPQMFCNDMSAEQTAAFLKRLGSDSWPMQTYTFSDWRYDQLGAVPSTYVACLRDNILPLSWQHRFSERFRCERTIQIDAGHQVMNTQPQELAETLLAEARK